MHKRNKPHIDIDSTIQSAERIDLFDGLNLDDFCVSPDHIKTAFQKQDADEDDETPSDIEPNNVSEIDPPKKQTSALDDVNFIIIPEESSEPEIDTNEQLKDRHRHLSENIARPPLKQKNIFINPLIEKAYHYAELTQIREKVFSSLEKSGGNSLLVASPYDNTGSTFLAAVLAYIGAKSYQKKVLLIDCNMRRAGLHKFFVMPQLYGFTDYIREDIPWQAVVKDTGVKNLSIITAGEHCENFSEYIRYSHIPNLLNDVQKYFDLIIFDTSPVLTPNRNNVNIVSLTSVVDYFLLLTKQSGTTKEDLKETKNVIEAGNGTIHGIVLNDYSPDKQSSPYPK